MSGRDSGTIVLLAVATVLVVVLAGGRYVDGHRDHDKEMLIDVLHLSALVQQQDAARWRAVAGTTAATAGLAGALAPEQEVHDRLNYLTRLGMSQARWKPLNARLDALQVDLHQLAGSSAGTAALETRISDDVRNASNVLVHESTRLKASEARADQIIDTGSAVALLLPAASAVALLMWRRAHLSHRRGTEGQQF